MFIRKVTLWWTTHVSLTIPYLSFVPCDEARPDCVSSLLLLSCCQVTNTIHTRSKARPSQALCHLVTRASATQSASKVSGLQGGNGAPGAYMATQPYVYACDLHPCRHQKLIASATDCNSVQLPLCWAVQRPVLAAHPAAAYKKKGEVPAKPELSARPECSYWSALHLRQGHSAIRRHQISHF